MQTQTGSNRPRSGRRITDEAGVALITALLALMLMSAMMAGMFAALVAAQRTDLQDRDQTQAYAAAHAGLEKLTSNTASLFATDWSPNKSQIDALMTTPPVIPGFGFKAPGGAAGSGYSITFTADANGNPASTIADITTGPFTGFKGLITPYQITVTAASAGGAEVRVRREIQTVAVPVLQFGVFSDSDLSFFAGDDFSFGGRVHTNKSLFVCEFGTKMTFTDRITVYEEVVHNYFSNGLSATSNCKGQVLIPYGSEAGQNRNLKQSPNEGSVLGMPGPNQVANTEWKKISTSDTYYKNWLMNGQTGAKKLDLPIVSEGATPIDLIRRPAVNSNENTVKKAVFGQRYFSQASLRILLSDRVSDLTGLPTITGGAPIALSGSWLQTPPAGYTVGASTPPIALSRGPSASATVTGKSGTSFQVSSVPAELQIPTLTVNTSPTQTVTCKSKTAASFTECTSNRTTSIPVGTTITASGSPLPVGFTPSAIVQTQVGSRANTSTVFDITTSTSSGNIGTLSFSTNTFFVDNVLWTCTGYDSTGTYMLSGCSSAQTTTLPTSGRISTAALSDRNEPLIGGYIKIEKQNASGNWSDVTAEILSLGIGASDQEGSGLCPDPTPNAVLRIQRLRDNGASCTYANSTNPYDWWPNTLYDSREGSFRTVNTSAGMTMGGVIQYISLDVANLKKWFAGSIGTTGTTAWNNNGYIVYFSDRRGDHNQYDGDKETAQYAFEDQVNPNSSSGTPDGVLQVGEDVNGNGVQDLWGKTPSDNVAGVIPQGAVAPYIDGMTGGADRPIPTGMTTGVTRVNKVVLFRRALKLVNGGSVSGVPSLPASGLSVVSENPVYVHGNYNATSSLAPNETHVPAMIVADAITLLSTSWSDLKSFQNPNDVAKRAATTTGYRFGAVAGKGLSFPHCGSNCGGSSANLFGTDGGAGNFLRLLEDWNTPNASVNYRGSLISLYISNQATGTFNYNDNVYDFAIRNFSFDTDFLTPALLPPGTPMFRDINTLKFRQILRPNQ